jgi:predicted metal-dependent enzyme (double-stranded beta helix superfamily)
MFESNQFIEDCRQGLREQNPHAVVREVVARAVSEPDRVLKSLGEPRLSGIQTLYRSDTLTILNVLWKPGMTLYPHEHRMWAVIGIYSGREDNSFYHRSESDLVAHGTKTLNLKDSLPLGDAVIHAVTNPLDGITAAIMSTAAISSPCRAANGIRKRSRSGPSTLSMPKRYLNKRTSA